MYKNYSELGAQPEPNRDLYQIEEINDPQQRQNILNNNIVVCIDVYAHWCGPCKQTEPSYALLAQQHSEPGRCAIVKENYEKKFTPGVGALPTYVFYVAGKKVDEVVGADLNQVEQKIQHYKQNASQIARQQQPQVRQTQQQAPPSQQQYAPPPPGFQSVSPGETRGPPVGRAGVRSFRPNQTQIQYFDQGGGQPYQSQSGNYHQTN